MNIGPSAVTITPPPAMSMLAFFRTLSECGVTKMENVTLKNAIALADALGAADLPNGQAGVLTCSLIKSKKALSFRKEPSASGGDVP